MLALPDNSAGHYVPLLNLLLTLNKVLFYSILFLLKALFLPAAELTQTVEKKKKKKKQHERATCMHPVKTTFYR